MKKYALLGEKLSHSYSSVIHEEILKDMGIDATYELLELEKNQLKTAIDKLKSGEYNGYNVTIPYKKEIMKYLDEISDEALHIGSVNTIVYENGKTIGYNTDYYGFYNELLYYNVDLKGKDCYILGTGGASLAVSKACLDLGANVYFVSRSNSDKENVITYLELEHRNIDVIVNTTPIGMYPNMGVSPLKKEITKKAKYVLDIIFNPRQTQLLKDANSNMDGLFMLVGQAIKAEEIWQKKAYDEPISKLLKRIEMKI